ncbi:DUF4440 domain-containing protein [Streptomyces sp. DSM 116496]|uniref:YybH family protein n=1 Tax=Streptomyces stoeckheimensis TaxID=3344656 RepID=UPI0038B3DF6C
MHQPVGVVLQQRELHAGVGPVKGREGVEEGFPPGELTVGREAIRVLWQQVLERRPRFEPEPPLPTLVSDGIALTSTPPSDGTGARAQVVRRQSDGSWLRLLDQPEFAPARAGRDPQERA